MRKIALLIIGFLFLSYTNELYACACSYRGTFVEVSEVTDIVVVGKIVKKAKAKMDVEITKTLNGKVETSTITILGAKDETSCLQSLEKFEVGDTYAFALDQNKKAYQLNGCGTYSLKIDNGTVEGVVTKDFGTSNGRWTRWNQRTMSEQEFLRLFSA